MKKIVLFIILLIPNLTFAVWWNPTTWNKTSQLLEYKAPEPKIIEKVIYATSTQYVEKPIEKTVTKMIENPETLKQLNELKIKYSELEAKYNLLRIDYGILKEKLLDPTLTAKPSSTLSPVCQELSDQITKKKEVASDAVVSQAKEIEDAIKIYVDYQKEITAIKNRTQIQIDTLIKEISAMQDKFKILCN